MAKKSLQYKNDTPPATKQVPISQELIVDEKVIEPKAEPSAKISKQVAAKVLVNVRKEATKSAEVVKILSPGEVEVVISESNGWYQFSDGYSMSEFYKEVK